MRRRDFIGTRWLGVGLSACLAVVTLGLALTGRLGLYINPDSAWFAVSMSVLLLVGAVASFALPLGAEADHGHDHADHSPLLVERSDEGAQAKRLEHTDDLHPLLVERSDEGAQAKRLGRTGDLVPDRVSSRSARSTSGDGRGGDHHEHVHRPHPVAFAATVVGGVAASGVVVLTLVLPPASLSAELAMSRDVGATPLFGGADTIQLASTGDTSSFGVGEWATAFATATNPDAFDGDPVELTGFVTPGPDGGFDLTRLVITHCVIDAQPASLPVIAAADAPETGQWVTISGTVRSSSDGRLVVDAVSVDEIPEPEDPYEY
ncbi:TIGR03943 family protein [Microbacterium sp. NEAU-LLC]|uniref:TIGR03943 family protein n=1 Tax=Microbacterium helvum TaxID=2773713 RepID=A0ABR8NT14_9MICO|nr:TIGR03943 family protein [Microbacterium helvum]MBD3943750.1 TIGR03943 family protein [Microbacterium helvum]